MNSALLFVDAGFLSELSKYFGKGNYIKFKIKIEGHKLYKVLNVHNNTLSPRCYPSGYAGFYIYRFLGGSVL